MGRQAYAAVLMKRGRIFGGVPAVVMAAAVAILIVGGGLIWAGSGWLGLTSTDTDDLPLPLPPIPPRIADERSGGRRHSLIWEDIIQQNAVRIHAKLCHFRDDLRVTVGARVIGRYRMLAGVHPAFEDDVFAGEVSRKLRLIGGGEGRKVSIRNGGRAPAPRMVVISVGIRRDIWPEAAIQHLVHAEGRANEDLGMPLLGRAAQRENPSGKGQRGCHREWHQREKVSLSF